MPKPRIYLDTTIPSAFHTDRADPDMIERRATTRIWWDVAARSFELVVSDVVLQELSDGRPEQALLRLELVKNLRRLRSGPAELATALAYMRQKVMPGNPLADALHLAIASHQRCDVLVTWNYHHLANPNKLDRIKKLNAGMGLFLPRILTPKQLLEGG
ncbi:type II toxin-antitoxin system VapC family toxin [Longimicrobium sp.]|uniref:type II toxin-antitoxin system VapC family toxin n=1 Tax=Longimicrobium sp. TaxID=2029185 RepID=UPI003B3ABC71